MKNDPSIWSSTTAEAKDLTLRMLEKDQQLRITAKEALDHPWFTLEQTDRNRLPIAQENMRKYCNGARFNVEKIKPEFGFVPAVAACDSSDSPASSGSSPDWDLSSAIDLSQPFDRYKQVKGLVIVDGE